jgi:hypothetical protein
MPCAPENKKAGPLPVKGSRPASAVRAVCRCQPAEPPAGLFACLSLTRLCYKSVMDERQIAKYVDAALTAALAKLVLAGLLVALFIRACR